MAVISRTFATVPGATRVFHPSLFGTTIYHVERNGVGLQAGSYLSLSNDQFGFAFGSIYVDPLNPFVAGEKIYVIYEN